MNHTTPKESPTPDALFDVLRSSRRRCLLRRLDREGDAVPVDALVEDVAARETGRSADELDGDAREPVLVSLYHNHLPKLVDAGLVDWETEDGTERVELLETDLPITPLLEIGAEAGEEATGR